METTERQITDEQVVKMAKMVRSQDRELESLVADMFMNIQLTNDQVRLFNREVYYPDIFDSVDVPMIEANIFNI